MQRNRAKTALNYAAAISVATLAINGIAAKAQPSESVAPITNSIASANRQTNEIYNFYLGQYQPRANISDEAVTNAVNTYLKKAKLDGKLVFIMDTWYGSNSVKEAVIDYDSKRKLKLPYLKSLFVTEQGKIINLSKMPIHLARTE